MMPAKPFARPAAAWNPPATDDDAPARRRRVPTLALDMSEGCRAFGVSENTLRDMIESGIVPAVKVGRRTLIPLDAARQRLSEIALSEARKRAGGGANL